MSKKVLIVHNNTTKLEKLKQALAQGGYIVTSTLNKDETISKCTEILPNLILIGNDIPIKECYRICWKLRESPTTKDIKVIIIKNDSNPLEKSWTVLKGADFYIATDNPFSDDNFIESMSSIN